MVQMQVVLQLFPLVIALRMALSTISALTPTSGPLRSTRLHPHGAAACTQVARSLTVTTTIRRTAFLCDASRTDY